MKRAVQYGTGTCNRKAHQPRRRPVASAPLSRPRARLHHALEDIYAYYRLHQRRIANVLRDASTMPVGGAFREAEDTWASALLHAWPGPTRRGNSLRAALALAVRFEIWHYLVDRFRLRDDDVIRLMHAITDDASRAS